jgi:REP element-mobilizing transposase RayT
MSLSMDSIDVVPGRAAHRLYCHFVWPTLGRIPLVSPDVAAVVERHVITLCRRLDAEPVCVRAFSDRLHVLLRLKPGHAPGTMVSRLKGGSEAAMQASGHTLRWGRGYAAATVSGADVRAVMRRIHRLVDHPLPRSASSRTRPRSGRTDRRGRRGPPAVVDAHRPER